MSKRLTTAKFIERAKQVHGDKYDYSKTEYVDAKTKVCITCPKHGEFWQAPMSHLNGIGCKACGYERNASNNTKTTEQFIEEAKKVHGDKYDYSKVEYKNAQTKVTIICSIHGEFEIRPYALLNGQNCPKCVHKSTPYTTEEWIEEVRKVHGDRYDYSKVEYKNNHTKVCIICPKHGEFWQTPNKHLSGGNCSKCHGNIKKTTEQFIEEAKKVHGDRYDYSKVEYKSALSKVCIICPIHGEFWQNPNDHLQGHGCQMCKESTLEKETANELNKNGISHLRQKKFSWLSRQSLDFYLPEYNVAIECQGIQHFKPIGHFGGVESFNSAKKRDFRKKQLCEEHGVKLYYINYDEDVETKLNNILEEVCHI